MKKQPTVKTSREDRLEQLRLAQNSRKEIIAAPVGRPSKITDEVVKELRFVFSIGGTDTEACILANISRPTLYKYFEDHPQFLAEREQMRIKPILKAKSNVIEALQSRDKQTSQWYLEKRARAEFGKEAQPIAVQVNVNTVQQERDEFA